MGKVSVVVGKAIWKDIECQGSEEKSCCHVALCLERCNVGGFIIITSFPFENTPQK